MIELLPSVRIKAWRAKPPRRCKPLPPSPLAGAAAASGSAPRSATRPNGEERTTMDHLDSAAGATPAIPMNREQSFAEPAGGRRRGRPKGSRNKATLALDDALEGAAEELTRTLIAKALAGDGAAQRFCVGRLLPARRDRPVVFELPEIESAGGLVKAARAVLAACAAGSLSPDEAKEVMNLIISVQAIEKTGCVEQRVTELERRAQACATKTSRE